MKKLFVLGFILALNACASAPSPKENYPYGMSEKEWNQLSIKDKAAIRRDFYFYEKGSTSFVNPQLQVEGREDSSANVFIKKQPAHNN